VGGHLLEVVDPALVRGARDTILGACDVFFFFQAEDGIRDLIVTGVQTCALPISAAPARYTTSPAGRRGARCRRRSGWCRSRRGRSEERRVGKECRSRSRTAP